MDLYVFGDESGDLVFTPKGSRYFILTTITCTDCAVGDQLIALRRQLAWEGLEAHPQFHAADESQAVRDRVFDVLGDLSFRVDATIFEKRKALPRLYTPSTDHFYKFAWFYHFKYVAPRWPLRTTRLLVVPATLGERKKKQRIFSAAIEDVIDQTTRIKDWRCAFWMARTDPCLWAVDYCSWAIQRRWEHLWQGKPDDRSWQLIKDKIYSEYEIFGAGKTTYY